MEHGFSTRVRKRVGKPVLRLLRSSSSADSSLTHSSKSSATPLFLRAFACLPFLHRPGVFACDFSCLRQNDLSESPLILNKTSRLHKIIQKLFARIALNLEQVRQIMALEFLCRSRQGCYGYSMDWFSESRIRLRWRYGGPCTAD